MTNDQLKEIRARADKATAGPWVFCKDSASKFWCWIIALTPYPWNAICQHKSSDADAEFIAHARTDIPALLEEVDRLRQKISVIEMAISDVCGAEGSHSISPAKVQATWDRLRSSINGPDVDYED